MTMNYEEWLRQKGQPHDITVKCARPACAYRGPPSTFCISTDNKWICSNCYHTENRPAEEFKDAWDKELGNDVKAVRNELLNKYGWTVTPVLNSMLTAVNILAWTTYINLLNTLTITYARPSQVVWPTIPTLVYK